MEKLTLVLAFSLWFILLRIVVIKIYAKNFVRDNGLDPNGKPWSFLPTRLRSGITFGLWLATGFAMWLFLPSGDQMFTNLYSFEVFSVCIAVESFTLLLNDAWPRRNPGNMKLMDRSWIVMFLMSCVVIAAVFQSAFLMIEMNLLGPLGTAVFIFAPMGAIVTGLSETLLWSAEKQQISK